VIDSGCAAISFRDVTKRYGPLTALDGIELMVPHGQTIAILGPNGAGKTTAVSLMLGLRTPTSGDVEVLGGDPRDVRTRSTMGAMLQASGIPAHLTVSETIELFRTYYPKAMNTGNVVALCGLQGKVKTRTVLLSNGQLQRLYLALAICGDPTILVLDEPTVGLDVEGRQALLATVDGISKRGRTVVLTTHYLEDADALADRIVVIDRGSIVADGSPAEIKASVGRKRIAFSCSASFESAETFKRVGDSFELLTDRPEAILRDLLASNLEISNLTVTGASLEEAFLQLTAHGDGHAA
jgi:ABC-2 type transport system ATP-binding protein